MKTLEAFVKEINESEELQKALKEIKDKAALEEFIQKNNCEATAEEFSKYAASVSEGEIDDEIVEQVAGGAWRDQEFR